MRAVVQRVTRAQVSVADDIVGHIGPGLLILIGITHDDTTDQAQQIADKIAHLRIMAGETSVLETGKAVLVVSQFTLYGDTAKGRRPSWAAAAQSEQAQVLYEKFADFLAEHGLSVARGVFGANMAVELVNDGPITLIVDSR